MYFLIFTRDYEDVISSDLHSFWGWSATLFRACANTSAPDWIVKYPERLYSANNLETSMRSEILRFQSQPASKHMAIITASPQMYDLFRLFGLSNMFDVKETICMFYIDTDHHLYTSFDDYYNIHLSSMYEHLLAINPNITQRIAAYQKEKRFGNTKKSGV